MKTENHAWNLLRERAAAQLPSNFADRVLRAARVGVDAAPSFVGHFVLSAVTAAACFIVVAIFQARNSAADAANNLAGWQQVASTMDDSSIAQ